MKEQHITEVDLSVKVSKELDHCLRDFVRLEDCRSYRQVICYLLEAFLIAARLNPALCLWLGGCHGQRHLDGQVRADIPVALYRAMERTSGKYGMAAPEFTRIALSTSLACLIVSVPRRTVLAKEELGSKILTYLKHIN